MPGVGDGAGLDCRVAFSVFFDRQVDVRFGFTAENVDAVVNLFQSLCNITFCVFLLLIFISHLNNYIFFIVSGDSLFDA